ncbi:RNA 2',3'-cyclic phosphodiesterase [Kroppenstedtia guangzhouensis]|uniref:RNA 2',3'-cyclic phosphodiesterase n=1 Tax=Kroppenstedtia guangzhouensis TaxID=1274356 RepID=A0ABQ1H023_9BACL|nr:RNA 2',3'-cyclic phosphodiesterase [Kroppenstedtia guangzhouensis]GGA54245.1 RNA 2',3'-cyclic phosphodiesterase [Kroppenstedtia guangzhouensis]
MGSHPVHRLFIAIPLPDAQKEMLARQCELMAKEWSFKKWVHPSDYHLTLQFLGACTFRQTREVQQNLKKLSPRLHPFHLSIEGIGQFGVPTRPRILWAGVEGNLEYLHLLYSHVIQAVESLGFPREKRPYRPHITLAKKYRFNDFPHQTMNRQFQPDFDRSQWTVEELVLYETHIYRSPMYQPRAVFRLGE